MSNANDKLHQQALDILADMKPTKDEKDAQGVIADWNERRKKKTLAFGKVASEIWLGFENGETYGGAKGKEQWCAIVGRKIRFVQEAITRYRISIGAVTAPSPSDDPNFHPLNASVGDFLHPSSIEFNDKEAYVVISITEWFATPQFYNVSGSVRITVRAEDVPLKKEMPCPACKGTHTVRDDGTYGYRITGVESARSRSAAPPEYKDASWADDYCKMSGKPVVITEDVLIKALYKKMKKTLGAMHLWDERIKAEFETAVKETKKEHREYAEARSLSARRGARTRAIKADSKVALVVKGDNCRPTASD